MMKSPLAWLAAACMTGASLAGGADASLTEEGPSIFSFANEAHTRPSEVRQLSFVRPGLIAAVDVREGDIVSEDDVLVRLDDRSEQAQMVILKTQAEDDTRIKYADAAMRQAKVDLERTQKAYEANEAATKMEVEHARLEVEVKEASKRLSEIEQEEAAANYEQMKVRLDQMRIKSPIAGKVERIMLREGEGADALEKVIAVVRIDPLWVDVPVQISKASRLDEGELACVQFLDEIRPGATEPGQCVNGKIVYKSSLAEVGTVTVRVEIPNSANRPAGEQVRVTFPTLGETAEAVPTPTPKPWDEDKATGKSPEMTEESSRS